VVVVTPPTDAPGAAILGEEAAARRGRRRRRAGAARRHAGHRSSSDLSGSRTARNPPPSCSSRPDSCGQFPPSWSPRSSSGPGPCPASSSSRPSRASVAIRLRCPGTWPSGSARSPSALASTRWFALNASEVVEIDVDHEGAVADLDTPEDYERWVEAVGS